MEKILLILILAQFILTIIICLQDNRYNKKGIKDTTENNINKFTNTPNFIERHPAWSLINVAITSAGLMWGIMYFIVYENRENLHKTEKDNIESKLESKEAQYASEISTLKQKIEILEIEKDKLKETNDIYIDCISTNPNLIPVLKKIIEDIILSRTNITDTIFITNQDHSSSTSNEIQVNGKQNKFAKINEGKTYVNNNMGIIIGLHDITAFKEATINLTLGGKSSRQEKVAVGQTFKYTVKEKNYTLIIKTIDYVRGYIEIEII